MNAWSRLNPAVRACARHSSHIVAVHHQALSFLVPLRGTDRNTRVFSGFFMDESRIQELERHAGYSPEGKPLRIFSGGNLEGRKGVALALQALALARKRGVLFHYHVSGLGPELSHLKRLARHLGLENDVTLGHGFPRSEFAERLKTFDLYLLPSLREGGGLSMMEAMLAGCVPIVADCGGPGDTVQNSCGFKIGVSTPGRMANEIAEVLLRLDRNRASLPMLGQAARERIATAYGETVFSREINRIYAETTLNKAPVSS